MINIVNKQLLKDTFENIQEEAKELTIGTVKKAYQELTSTGTENKFTPENLNKNTNDKNFTNLNTKDLENKYKDQDKINIENTRNHLFQLVKKDEQEVIAKNKNIEKQKIEEEEYLKQEKIRQQNTQKEDVVIAPKGKERKNILGGKSKKTNLGFETQIAKGK